MKFAQHWCKASARAGTLTVEHWGWSDVSADDARRDAEEKVRALAAQVAKTGHWPASYNYKQDGRPLREEIVSEQRDASGALRLAITRNSYGCLVLNSADALFIDIDDAQQKSAALPGFGALLGSLFGRKPPPAPSPAVPAGPLAPVEAWVRAHPGWGFRVYRTKAGHRLLATHAPFAADDEQAVAAMKAVGADPLYLRLCSAQQCFRARLTPKPWRVGVSRDRPRYPYGPHDAGLLAKWTADYDRAVQGHAVCRFERTIGSEYIHPGLPAIVRLHDEATHAMADEPLA
jgi:hypothetical protein